MNEYRNRLNSILNDVECIIEDEHDMIKYFLLELFNLLFWKNYYEGYVDINTKYELVGLIDYYEKHKSGGDTWYSFTDVNHVNSIISKVRKAIGIKEDLPK